MFIVLNIPSLDPIKKGGGLNEKEVANTSSVQSSMSAFTIGVPKESCMTPFCFVF